MNGKISLKVNVSKSKYNIIKHAQEIVDEVNKRTIGKLYNTALDICNNAVNAYYNDFNPHLYVRERSLDTAYKISIDKNNMLDFQLGNEFMEGYHDVDSQDDEYIYNVMFKWGYHGGATSGDGHPDPGVPYWKIFNGRQWHWYKPAPKSDSPYEQIVEKWNEFCDGEGKDFQIEELKKILKKYLKYT